MAGLSSRFYKEGYTQPKFQLKISNETMFEWAVKSFENYFKTDKFLFVARNNYEYESFIKDKIKELGIINYRIYLLDSETKGQAETVYKGIFNNQNFITNEGLYIFNIDSKRNNFSEPIWLKDVDGYLELFEGEGDHWSFAEIDKNNNVVKTAEKNRISNYCSNGLYYFKNFKTYELAYLDLINNSKFEKGECYIAPMYNYLIENGLFIKGDIISRSLISFCGTPTEYNSIISNK